VILNFNAGYNGGGESMGHKVREWKVGCPSVRCVEVRLRAVLSVVFTVVTLKLAGCLSCVARVIELPH